MARKKYGSHTIDLQDILGMYGMKINDGVIKAIKDGGEKVKAMAVENCPEAAEDILHKKGYPVLPKGTLKNSIRIIDKTKDKNPKVVITADAKNPVDGVEYGHILEYSAKINRPFMFPALDRYRDEIRANIIDAIKKAVSTK